MNDKIGRNAQCPCGSGEKYKNCCLNKGESHIESFKKMPENVLLEAIHFGLSALRSCSDSSRKINVIKIYRKQNILVIEFIPYSNDSVGLKIECAQIIQFIIQFLVDENHPSKINIDNITARAVDNNNNEIMYASSSIDTANYLKNNRMIEWLKFSLFNDNSDETILSQSKIKISRLEKGFRGVIVKVLHKKYGQDWWSNLTHKCRSNAENIYINKYGDSTLPNGKILIEYTYLLGLKKIILNHWQDFEKHFNNKRKFSDNIDRLNLIRREESHNRIITPNQLNELEEIYKYIASLIASKHRGLIPKFLVENWRIEMKAIVQNISDNMEDAEESHRYNHVKMINILNQHRGLYLDAIKKLDVIIVPSGKKKLTEQFKDILKRSANALYNMIESVKVLNKNAIKVARDDYSKCMSDIKNFEKDYLLSEL